MKKLFVILGAAALILAGCDRGGTSDQYDTSSGNVTSSNSMPGANSTTNSTVNP
jgi:hypothetical protein